MENEEATQSTLETTLSHPLDETEDSNAFPSLNGGSSNTTHRHEGSIFPRIRIISLHLLLYLFQSEHDYVFMMQFLRELLDWIQKQEEFRKLQLPVESDDCPLNLSSVRKLSSHCSLSNDVVDSIIHQCLESELSDFEMACKIEDAGGFEIVEQVDEMSEGLKNPLYIWQFMFDADEYNITEFIKPLQTGNFGLIVKLMISYAMSCKSYDARIRTYILALSQVLKIDYQMLQAYELAVVDEIHSVNQYKKKKERMTIGGIAAVGLAATGGAVLMTLTGGLAAPFVVSGLATIVGTSSTAFLATTTGLAAIAAVFGAVGGGLAGYKVSKLVGSIDEFEFVKLKEEPSVALTIMVNGLWKSTPDELQKSNWAVLSYSNEQYLLKYESKHLLRFTSALSDFVKDAAVSLAADELVKYTIFAALASSLAWPVTLLSLTSVIDNPWSVCMGRSKAVGIHLSSVLIKKLHGDRPVTLIGYGLGARVIFFCLLDMVTKNKPEMYSGILENAVLCGAPVTSQPLVWKKLCGAVSGKLVNGYSNNDWVLSFLYKTTRVTRSVAGVRSVDLNNRKMVNVDLSSVISGHSDYISKMGDILKIIGMGQ